MEKLPKGWIECEVGDFLYLKNGYAFKSKDYQEKGIPLIRISDIQQGYVTTIKSTCIDESNVKEDFLIQKGDVLVAMSGATTGKYGIFKEEIKVLQNQRVGNLKPIVENTIDRKFIYYLLGALKEEIEEKAYGGAQPNISSKLIEGIKTNLPPLPEQQRIVTKLDTLFASLENTKSRLEKIPQLLKNFRQAVLTQAVTGKLTEEWRKGKELEKPLKDVINDNYLQRKLPLSWSNTIIQNVGSVKGGKRLPKGEELVTKNTGLPYIRARDLKQGTVLTDNLLYLTPETQEKIKRYIVCGGDVYITIVGAKIGDAGVIPSEMNGANLTENAAKITDLESVNSEYFSIWLRSEISQQNIRQTIMSAAQGKLALTRIKTLPIYIPTIKEQQEIVRRVESLFVKADAIEKRYEALKQKIDTLPQALLAKAFKGELVEQLPTDGDAKDLLAEIQKAKESLIAKPKGRKKK